MIVRTGALSTVVLSALSLGACGSPSTRLSGSERTTCVIDESNALLCWGAIYSAPYGRITPTPTRVDDARWREVSAGPSHACAIRVDGSLWCWGRNCAGPLADGTREDRETPVRVGTASNWRHVATGGGKSCAIDDSGALWCWGGPDYGQEACADTPSAEPFRVAGRWREVSAHFYDVQAIRDDGTLWRMHDVGDISNPTSPAFGPLEQVGSSTWRTVATGLYAMRVCGIHTDGSLYCGAEGETRVGTESDWIAIAARQHACAIRSDGSLWCWGRNDMGQLGSGSPSSTFSMEPTRVGNQVGWSAVTAGWDVSCGMRGENVFCWGAGHVLGSTVSDADAIYAPTPVQF